MHHAPMMKLHHLFRDIPHLRIRGPKSVSITGLSADSRTVAPGNLFIARRGVYHDGTSFVRDACAAGAAAIVTEAEDPTLQGVAQVICEDVGAIESLLAATYYNFPANELLVVGITGTNGKTTTALLLHHTLEVLGCPAGLISTVGVQVRQQKYPNTYTTPDACTSQRFLREMVSRGCHVAIIEATSHGLVQGRLDYIQFDLALFTNLTRDHLDYHSSMAEYAAAKAQLFARLRPSSKKLQTRHPCAAIVNLDSAAWRAVCAVKPEVQLIGYHASAAPKGQEAGMGAALSALEFGAAHPMLETVCADGIEAAPTSTTFTVAQTVSRGRRAVATCKLPFVGVHNVSNALAALAAATTLGHPLEAAAKALASAPPLPGRLEQVASEHAGFLVYVDFAHTPDALKTALSALRALFESSDVVGRLIVVFGCGGERDPGKRPLMGAVASELADRIVITNDNPRRESPVAIAEAIVVGADLDRTEVILDRREAIGRVLREARAGDIILIAGRGHETAQLFDGYTVSFNDRQVVEELLAEQRKRGESDVLTPC